MSTTFDFIASGDSWVGARKVECSGVLGLAGTVTEKTAAMISTVGVASSKEAWHCCQSFP